MLASLFLLLNAYTITLNNCWAHKPRSWPNIGFRLWWGRAWQIWMTAGRYHASNVKGHHLWIFPQHAIKKDTLSINEMVQSFFQTVKNLHVMYIEWTVMVLSKSKNWLHICPLVTKKLMLGDENRDDFIVRINMNNIVNSHFFCAKRYNGTGSWQPPLLLLYCKTVWTEILLDFCKAGSKMVSSGIISYIIIIY